MAAEDLAWQAKEGNIGELEEEAAVVAVLSKK